MSAAQARPVTGDPAAARPVLQGPEVGRAVDRMAHELLEKTRGGAGVVLLGIPTRGVPLAKRIAARIVSVEGIEVPVGSLDVTMYRDDLRMRPARTLLPTEIPPAGIDGKVVVLVDDVLFSGRTIRAALDAMNDLARRRGANVATVRIPEPATHQAVQEMCQASEATAMCLRGCENVDQCSSVEQCLDVDAVVGGGLACRHRFLPWSPVMPGWSSWRPAVASVTPWRSGTRSPAVAVRRTGDQPAAAAVPAAGASFSPSWSPSPASTWTAGCASTPPISPTSG